MLLFDLKPIKVPLLTLIDLTTTSIELFVVPLQVKVPPPKPKVNKIVEKLKAANTSKLSPFQKFLAHDRFTDMMKTTKTPNYHQMGGLDFMARFPDIDPDVAKGLASSYQTIFEGGRAIADGPGGYTLEDAMNKAAEESRLNAVGIDAFSDPNSETYKQYTSPEDRKSVV